MGVRISRSIVESHGERLSTVDNSPRGASFYLTLLIKARGVNDAPNPPHGIRRRRRRLSACLHPWDAEVGWLACRNFRDAARVLAKQTAERAMLPGPGCETSRSQRFGFSARIG